MQKLKRLMSSLLAFSTLISSCATAMKPSQKNEAHTPETRITPPTASHEESVAAKRPGVTKCGELTIPVLTITPPPEDHAEEKAVHLPETQGNTRAATPIHKKRVRFSPDTKGGEPEMARKPLEVTDKAFNPSKSKLIFSYTQLCNKTELESLISFIVDKLCTQTTRTPLLRSDKTENIQIILPPLRAPDKTENIQIILPIFVGYLCKFPSKDSYQFIQDKIKDLKEARAKYYAPTDRTIGFLDSFSKILSEHEAQICRPGGCDLIRDRTFHDSINEVAHKFEGNIDVIKSFLEIVKIEDILNHMCDLIDMDISVLPHESREYQLMLRYIGLIVPEVDFLIDHMCKDDPKLLPLLPIYKTQLLDIKRLLPLKLNSDGKVKES